jgi:hypothetical protein
LLEVGAQRGYRFLGDIFVSGTKSQRLDLIDHTIEEPSRLSSGVSSISKVADAGRAYELIDYRPIWGLTTNS